MKPRQKSALCFSVRPSNWLGLCTLTFSLLAAGPAIAQTTWTGGVDSDWNDAGNWSSGVPVNGTVINFGGAPSNGPTNNDIVGLIAGGISLTNNGTAGQTAAFTLGTLGQSIELGGGITTAAIAGGGTPITDTINLNLVIPTDTFRLINTALGHDVLVNGVISGGAGTSLSKGGAGVLTLAGANAYTSFTYIDSGTLKLGAANVLPNTTVEIKRASGTDTNPILDLNGFSDTIGAINLGSVTTDAANSGQTVSILNSGVAATLTPGGSITYNAGSTGFLNGQATISANLVLTGTRPFIVGDGSAAADMRVSGVISGAAGNNITKQGLGTLELSGNNTYAGALNIQEGRVRLGANDVLPNSSVLQLGIGGSNSGVVFDLNGFSDTVGVINLASSTSSVANLSHTLVNTGSAAALKMNGNLTYNAGAANFNNGTATVSANLDLNGADRTFTIGDSVNAVQDTIISGNITNGTGSAGLIKAGNGVLTLSGTNSYNGNTSATGGVLRIDATTALPSSNVSLNGGVLGLGNDLSLGSSDFDRALGTGSNQIQLPANNSGFAAYGADRVVNLGGSSVGLTIGVGGFLPNTGNITFSLGAASATHTLTFANPINLGDAIPMSNKFFNIGNGSAAVDAILTGAITQNVAGHNTFSKAGDGTLQLDNTGNAWTGNTFVDSGKLRLGNAGVIPNGSNVTVKRGNGVSAAFSGILDLNGYNETIAGLTLGETTPNATNLGQTPSVVDSAGTTAVLTLGGNVTYQAGTSGRNGQATISANLATGNAARSINVGDGSATDDLVIPGGISGSGALTKQGSGTLLLSGANSHTGRLDVQAGTVKLGANNVLPDANGLRVGVAASTTNAVFDINGRTETVSTLDINGDVGFVGVTPGGTSHSIIDSAGGGVLTLGGAFAVQASSTAFKNGTATISANINTGNAQRNFTINDSTGSTDVDLRISGQIVGINGFNKANAGTLALSGSNTFSGVSTLSTGIILVENSLAFQNSPVSTGTAGTGQITLGSGITTLTVGGLRTTDRDLSDVITNYSTLTALTINPGAASASTFTKVIGDNSASMTITKTGGGSQTFAGDNTYKGATAVNAGSLIINGAQSGATGAVSVSNAGTRLMGIGTIGGATTINDGAIYSPGNAAGAVGSQILSSNLTFGNGSIFEWDINADSIVSGFDTVNVGGNLNGSTGGDTSIFRVVFGATAKAGVSDTGNAFWNTASTTQTWSMTSLFGKDFTTGLFTSVQTYDSLGAFDVSSKGSFTITGSSLTWTAVPEPSSALAGLLLAAGLLRRRRA